MTSSFCLACLGTVAKLWSILKRLIFEQCLIYMCLSLKNVGFNSRFYFLVQIRDRLQTIAYFKRKRLNFTQHYLKL